MTTDRRVHFENGLMVDKGASMPAITIPALTNGQLAIGSTGNAPVPGTLTGSGGLVVTGGPGTLALTTRGYVATAVLGNGTTVETDLHKWVMPANTVLVNTGIVIMGAFSASANANTKTLKFYVGGSSMTLNPTTTAPNGITLSAEIRVWWGSATTAIVSAIVHRPTALELASTVTFSTTIDWTAATTIKFTGQGAATNDIFQLNVAMLAFRGA